MENSNENNNLPIESISSAGAPVGNQNAKKGKLFYGELQKVLVQEDKKKLRNIAEKLVTAAEAGEAWAIKEVMDRVDGKAVQSTEVSGIGGEPIEIKAIEFVIKRPE